MEREIEGRRKKDERGMDEDIESNRQLSIETDL